MMDEIITYLKFGRTALEEAVEALSQRELTEIPIYETWTVKDVLAHIVGWNQRVLTILPLILADQANAIPGVEVEVQNQRSVAAFRQTPVVEVLAELEASFNQIYEIIVSLDPKEIDRRHARAGRFITIRSYIIDIMVEHERQHALEIEQWRKRLEQAIDPQEIKAKLNQSRARFMTIVKQLSPEQARDNTAVGRWSVSDVVGHLADWEQRMLQAARHIHDPSLPPAPVPDPSEPEDHLNQLMVNQRVHKTWQDNVADLHHIQAAVDMFVDGLIRGDWRLRGPFPWPDDHGTLAELLTHIADHYDDHLPDVESWHKRQSQR